MNEEPTHKQSMAPLDTSTRLAYERTYLAHERILMVLAKTRMYPFSQRANPPATKVLSLGGGNRSPTRCAVSPTGRSFTAGSTKSQCRNVTAS